MSSEERKGITLAKSLSFRTSLTDFASPPPTLQEDEQMDAAETESRHPGVNKAE